MAERLLTLLYSRIQILLRKDKLLLVLCSADDMVLHRSGSSGSAELDSIFRPGLRCRYSPKSTVGAGISNSGIRKVHLDRMEKRDSGDYFSFIVDVPVRVIGNVIRLIVIVPKEDYSTELAVAVEQEAKFFSSFNVTDSVIQSFQKPSAYEQKIFEAMSDGFMVVDREGRIQYLNPKGCSILGVGPEYVGNLLRDLTLFEPELMEVLKTGAGWTNREFIVDLKTKKNLHLVKTAVPLYEEDGTIVGVVDIFKEIKEVRNFVNKMVGAQSGFTFQDIIFESGPMHDVVQTAKKIAPRDCSVLIQGESGTGKELFAHAIHEYSSRNEGPFITVDCATLPGELVESELFGYVGGAFTGARRGGRPGKFEMAEQGTIFLDEIGEMSLDIQKKFLRVLQSHTITRIGDHIPIPVNIRIIAATNRDLETEVAQRNFREDLLYRLNVISLHIPALRHRKDDIIPTARYFVRTIGSRLGRGSVKLGLETEAVLEEYPWPGNVRQLKNAIERALILSDDEIILPRHLPDKILSYTGNIEQLNDGLNNERIISLEEAEIHQISQVLDEMDGNRSRAAEKLGIARSTLYEKLRKYRIS